MKYYPGYGMIDDQTAELCYALHDHYSKRSVGFLKNLMDYLQSDEVVMEDSRKQFHIELTAMYIELKKEKPTCAAGHSQEG